MNVHSRREFLNVAMRMTGMAAMAPRFAVAQTLEGKPRPNVVLILTDDQGYGDLGCHGNDTIKTPNLDKLHDESVRFDRFYVSPVCAPTRASLMTGRYNYRTGAIDTYIGRAMMYPDEVTVAELLSAGGYRTGIFGKWHLGDNYPMRAMDQGFQESLVHRGGGLCQPSDWPGNTYFDPILSHNGQDEKSHGYCTDVFTNAAMAFIEANRDWPFFVYLPTNAPHTPLQVDDKYVAPYRALGLDEDLAKVYGMVANVDENVGRLLAKLDALGLADNTIVLFITDNGPQSGKNGVRWNAGMRGAKGTVYEGGIRVPCFVRWPARLEAGKVIDRIAAHIDVMPTLLDACGVAKPEGLQLDGRDLMPLLLGEAADWPDRTLYFQWHRGDVPELYRDCAARGQRYKLVNGKELYDIETDPGEQHDVAAANPEIVAAMRAGYEAWFKDVGGTRGYAPPRIYLGTSHENPTVLTRQDWRGAEGWGPRDLGHWEVHVAREGTFDVTLLFDPLDEPGEIQFRLGNAELKQTLDTGATACMFAGVAFEAGDGRLEASVPREGKRGGVDYVEVRQQ